jgi:hypothetical protein
LMKIYGFVLNRPVGQEPAPQRPASEPSPEFSV